MDWQEKGDPREGLGGKFELADDYRRRNNPSAEDRAAAQSLRRREELLAQAEAQVEAEMGPREKFDDRRSYTEEEICAIQKAGGDRMRRRDEIFRQLTQGKED